MESSDVTKNMGTAIAAWKNHDYEKFGSLVGVTLRQLALTTFPEKYAVDDMGVLRRKLLNLDQIGQHSAFQVASRSWLYVIAGLLISSFAALVLIRTQRTVARYGPVETQSRSHPILESFDREDMQV